MFGWLCIWCRFWLFRTTASGSIFVASARRITLFFYASIIFHKTPRLTFAQNLKTMPASSSNKKIKERKRINFKSQKATTVNSVLFQNDKILVIFQYLQTNYCIGAEIFERCFTLRSQLINIWIFPDKKISIFSRLHFFDVAKGATKCLLKLTENSELNTKTALKTRSLKLTRTSSEFKD